MLFYRAIEEKDREMLARWIAMDPDHRETCDAEFWIAPPTNCISYAMEDDDGPILFVRQDAEGKAIRIHIQFPPDEKLRIARALSRGVIPVKEWAKQRGFTKLIFDSVSPRLIAFTERLGFHPEYVCSL